MREPVGTALVAEGRTSPVMTISALPSSTLSHLSEETLDALAFRRVQVARREAAVRHRYGWDLTWAGFMAKMRLLTPQSYGGRIERYMAHVHGWAPVAASLDRGDVVDGDGQHWEIKVTIMDEQQGARARANFVQLRQHQDIAGYHLFAIGADNQPVHFTLTKAEMADELEQRSSLAHGTRGSRSDHRDAERAVRIRTNDPRWQQWLHNYARTCVHCPQ